MHEQVIAVNGTELWVAAQGSGAPLILCSGGPGCCDYLEPVAAMVDDLVSVYRFEPRGCGRSSAAGPYDLRTCLADFEALRARLGYERWLVGGHSWGAFLALAYAIEYSDRTAALIYLSGAGVQDDREWHAAYQAGRDAGREHNPRFAHPVNMEVNRAGNTSTREFIKDSMLLRRISKLDVPMVAVHGDADIRPDWPVRQLVNLMPNARFELIEGAQHFLWLTHADQLRSVLRAFLAARGDEESSADVFRWDDVGHERNVP
jgi:proline iminopeptidase